MYTYTYLSIIHWNLYQLNLCARHRVCCSGLEISFFGGSKLMVPSSRSGSKTNFVVAKLYVHFYAVVFLGCVDDRITNITQKCIKLTIL